MKRSTIPRNCFVLSARMRGRQIFHHRAMRRGGDHNLMREYLAEVDEENATDLEEIDETTEETSIECQKVKQ